MRTARCILVAVLAAACGGPPNGPSAPIAIASSPTWGVVAEGLCPKLSANVVGGRTVLVYGETGYVARDWGAGEALPAAQSLALLRPDGVFLDPSLVRGLPRRDGGWVTGDLTLGGENNAWLVRSTTRYSARHAGALFEREERAYAWTGAGWSLARADEDGVRRVPSGEEEPSSKEACGPEGKLSFVRLASHAAPNGDLFVAGRCRDDGPVNRRDSAIVVLSRSFGAQGWSVTSAPIAPSLDAIVDVALFAISSEDAWLSAYEPFKPTSERKPELLHFDGRTWAKVWTPAKSGISSISGFGGTLYLAAGRELLARAADGSLRTIEMPPLAFTTPMRPDSLRITGVRAGNGETFVEGGFLVRDHDRDVRASVLFRSPAPAHAIYCDATKSAELALANVPEAR